jgi:hypothetical protein
MSQNPLNLAVRFLLELCILAALGRWGWMHGTGIVRWLLVLALPLAAALWGTFRGPNDGGPPTVLVAGGTRLIIEGALFAAATAALVGAGHRRLAIVFAAAAILHYAVSWDRVQSLLRDGRGTDRVSRAAGAHQAAN